MWTLYSVSVLKLGTNFYAKLVELLAILATSPSKCGHHKSRQYIGTDIILDFFFFCMFGFAFKKENACKTLIEVNVPCCCFLT